MQKISDLLQDLIEDVDKKTDSEQVRIIEYIDKACSEETRKLITDTLVVGKTIYIDVAHPAHKTLIEFDKESIIEYLRAKVPTIDSYTIKIRVIYT